MIHPHQTHSNNFLNENHNTFNCLLYANYQRNILQHFKLQFEILLEYLVSYLTTYGLWSAMHELSLLLNYQVYR